MSQPIPKPSLLSLALQSALVIAFGGCLYLFVTTINERDSYRKAMDELGLQRQNLQRAIQSLTSYHNFIAENPFYQCSSNEILWEKGDEVWTNLSYEELLARLQGLYRGDRPFVLDFFSAGITGADEDLNQDDGQPKALRQSDGSGGQKDLIFHLQGYFLCPCK